MACYVSLTMQVFDIDGDLLPNTDPESCGAGMKGLKFSHSMHIHAFSQEHADLACRAFEAYLRQIMNESADAHAVIETLQKRAGEVEDPDSDEIFSGLLNDTLIIGGGR